MFCQLRSCGATIFTSHSIDFLGVIYSFTYSHRFSVDNDFSTTLLTPTSHDCPGRLSRILLDLPIKLATRVSSWRNWPPEKLIKACPNFLLVRAHLNLWSRLPVRYATRFKVVTRAVDSDSRFFRLYFTWWGLITESFVQ